MVQRLMHRYNSKTTGPASSLHAKSIKIIGYQIPGSTTIGDFATKDVIDELRIITLDEVSGDDGEYL